MESESSNILLKDIENIIKEEANDNQQSAPVNEIPQQITITCEEGQSSVQFDGQILKLSTYLSKVYEEEHQPRELKVLMPQLKKSALKVLKSLLQAHQYSEENMQWELPLRNTRLCDHIDDLSYQSLKKFEVNKQCKLNEVQAMQARLTPVLLAANQLELLRVKKILNIVLQIPYFLSEGSSVQEYCSKWNIEQNDFRQDNLQRVEQQNKILFQTIKQKYVKQLQALKQEQNKDTASLEIQPQEDSEKKLE